MRFGSLSISTIPIKFFSIGLGQVWRTLARRTLYRDPACRGAGALGRSRRWRCGGAHSFYVADEHLESTGILRVRGAGAV